MNKNSFFDALVQQLCEALPAHLSSFKKDFEQNCHFILQKTFSKFDLVTREEFEAQTKVLARTRKKLEELQKIVDQLESRCTQAKTDQK